MAVMFVNPGAVSQVSSALGPEPLAVKRVVVLAAGALLCMSQTLTVCYAVFVFVCEFSGALAVGYVAFVGLFWDIGLFPFSHRPECR